MTDDTWTVLMTISVCVAALLVAADRGWFSYAAELAGRLGKAVVRVVNRKES
jgi:hypothetical protein